MKWLEVMKRHADIPSTVVLTEDMKALERDFPGTEFSIRFCGFHVLIEAAMNGGKLQTDPITRHNHDSALNRFRDLLDWSLDKGVEPSATANGHAEGFSNFP